MNDQPSRPPPFRSPALTPLVPIASHLKLSGRNGSDGGRLSLSLPLLEGLLDGHSRAVLDGGHLDDRGRVSGRSNDGGERGGDGVDLLGVDAARGGGGLLVLIREDNVGDQLEMKPRERDGVSVGETAKDRQTRDRMGGYLQLREIRGWWRA